MILAKDLLTLTGTLLLIFLVFRFQKNWVGQEFTAATLLKLNREKSAAVFSLPFIASLSITFGTYFSAVNRPGLLRLFFDAGLLLWLVFFLLLDSFSGGDWI